MIFAVAVAVAVAVGNPDSARVPQRPADRWVAEDKLKHFALSYTVTAFAFAGALNVFDTDASRTTAVVAGITAGVLKELYDRAHAKPFSGRDLIWDVAGVALGYIVVRQVR
jgi:uncharacterized protein YfiM (DUF2279 family)